MIDRQAGADYLAALQRLGLNPECLFWAEDEIVGHPVLVLVTRQFDRVGPLSLSRLLFKAYNAAATPRAIDPFALRLHSPDQELIRELARRVAAGSRGELRPAHHRESMSEIRGGGLSFQPGWIYRWNVPIEPQSTAHLSRQWKRFAANVDRLAA